MYAISTYVGALSSTNMKELFTFSILFPEPFFDQGVGIRYFLYA